MLKTNSYFFYSTFFLFFFPPFLGAYSSYWDFLDFSNSNPFYFFHSEFSANFAVTSTASLVLFLLLLLTLLNSSLMLFKYWIKKLHNSIYPMYLDKFSCFSLYLSWFSYCYLFFSHSISLIFLFFILICH